MEGVLRVVCEKEEETSRFAGSLESWTERLLRTALDACDEESFADDEGFTATVTLPNMVCESTVGSASSKYDSDQSTGMEFSKIDLW